MGAGTDTDGAVSFDDAVEELYGLPRDDFVPRRDELVRAARGAKDRETATAIGRLRKPSVAAWMANALAREHPEEIGALADLGASLRDAQDRLEGDALRRLSRRRHELLSALVERARRVAREDGVRIGDAAERELRQTVAAALADPDAARALAAGHLVTALEPGAGLGRAAASSSRAPARPGRTRRPPAPSAPAPSAPAAADPVAGDPVAGEAGGPGRPERERAERERAERAERERAERAERERAEAQRARAAVEAADAAVADAAAGSERAASATAGAEADVADRRERLAAAEETLRRVRDDASEAERVLAARRRDAADARERLRALGADPDRP